MLVKICRFSDTGGLRLRFETIDIKNTAYFAISHVWGPVEQVDFRALPGVDTSGLQYANHPELDGKAKVSLHKARFLSSQLPSLIKDAPFWMDVLCIDQADDNAILGVCDRIPDIYSNASKLIAIRDGEGLRDCCVENLGDISCWQEKGLSNLVEHSRDAHFLEATFDERYLQRLWPLQELLLCNTVQFTSCQSWFVKPTTNDPNEISVSVLRMLDHLSALARSWLLEKVSSGPKITEFMHAFLNCETISRNGALVVHRSLSPSSDELYQAEINSMRTTSKARDFILAVMPLYTWWQSPGQKGELKKWCFPQIFSYCAKRAREGNHGFLGTFTRGMTDVDSVGNDTAWLPSEDIPIPENLGDFYKLLGSPSPATPSEKHGILMNRVRVFNYTSSINFKTTLDFLASCMKFSALDWRLAQRGELSKYGALPEERFRILDLGGSEQNSERVWFGLGGIGPFSLDCIERDAIAALSSLLSSLLLDFDNSGLEAEWNSYKEYLVRADPPGLKSTMVLMAAMVGCGIGLSARFGWVSQTFYPVLVEIHKNQPVLGLLSKSYLDQMISPMASEDRSRFMSQPMSFYCVQRLSHSMGWTGRDVVLVPSSGTNPGRDGSDITGGPVGLVSRLPTENIQETQHLLLAYRHTIKIDNLGREVAHKEDNIYI